jgi:hypothetical protein
MPALRMASGIRRQQSIHRIGCFRPPQNQRSPHRQGAGAAFAGDTNARAKHLPCQTFETLIVDSAHADLNSCEFTRFSSFQSHKKRD